MKTSLLFCLWMLAFSLTTFSQIPEGLRVVRVGETIVSPAALKVGGGEQLVGQAFQQDALISYKGYQYTTYYNAERHVCIARRKLPLGEWMEVALPYTTGSSDPHNVISMGICAADGTIHLAYDHHDHPLHYCRSAVNLANEPETMKWSADNFGLTTSELVPGTKISGVCYPRFISRPDGNLFFECRHGSSGSGDSHLRLYTGETHAWSNFGRYIQGRDITPEDACAYINRVDYDTKGRLHVSWVWRDTPSAPTNHDLSYAYSDDNGLTWYDTHGLKVGETEKIEPTGSRERGKCLGQSIPSLIVNPIRKNRGLINQESHHTDTKGRIHILNSYMLSTQSDDSNWGSSRGKAVLHQQFRDVDGTWKTNAIKKNETGVVSSVRSQIVLDAFDNAFVVANKAEVYAATSKKEYADWALISGVDNGRFACEPQIDHPLISSDGVLSFVYLGTDTKVYVIDYLLDNPHTLDGKGLHTQYFSNADFSTLIFEENAAVAVTPITGTKSIRWYGSLETRYGEAYQLQIKSDVSATVYLNGKKIGKTVPNKEFSTNLTVVASHRHNIVIEAQADEKNSISLSWSSKSTPQEEIPITSLYPEKVKIDESDNMFPHTPQMDELTDLPIKLLTEEKTIKTADKHILLFPFNPINNYSVEVEMAIREMTGGYFDVEASSSSSKGFCISLDTKSVVLSTLKNTSGLQVPSDNEKRQKIRFTVYNENVYIYLNGTYLYSKPLEIVQGKEATLKMGKDYKGGTSDLTIFSVTFSDGAYIPGQNTPKPINPPELEVKEILPTLLQNKLTIAGKSNEKEIYNLKSFNPLADYSLEVSAVVTDGTGRGLDIQTRAKQRTGFRTSISTSIFRAIAPFNVPVSLSKTRTDKEQVIRYAVKGNQVHIYKNGRYLSTLPLRKIDEMNAAGTQEIKNPLSIVEGAKYRIKHKASGLYLQYFKNSNGDFCLNPLLTNAAFEFGFIPVEGVENTYKIEVTTPTTTGYISGSSWNCQLGTNAGVQSQIILLPNEDGTFQMRAGWYSGNVINLDAITPGSRIFADKSPSANSVWQLEGINLVPQELNGLLFGKNYIQGTSAIEVHYIKYDDSGAYAPKLGEEEDPDVYEEIIENNSNLILLMTADKENQPIVYTADKQLYIGNIDKGSQIRIYDISGRLICQEITDGTSFRTPLQMGIYIVTVNNYRIKITL